MDVEESQMVINVRNRNRIVLRYIHCKRCNQQILLNKSKKCNKCNNEIVWNTRENYNNNEGDDEALVLREQLGGTIKYNTTINKRNIELKNQGFIDSKKHEDCVRILAINPRGLRPNNQEKTNMLKQAIVAYEIDAVLFSGTDRR